MGFFGDLDDPVVLSLLEHSPDFYLQRFPEASLTCPGKAFSLFS